MMTGALSVTSNVVSANSLWLAAVDLMKDRHYSKNSVSGGIADSRTCRKLAVDEFGGNQAGYRSDCQTTHHSCVGINVNQPLTVR